MAEGLNKSLREDDNDEDGRTRRRRTKRDFEKGVGNTPFLLSRKQSSS